MFVNIGLNTHITIELTYDIKKMYNSIKHVA